MKRARCLFQISTALNLDEKGHPRRWPRTTPHMQMNMPVAEAAAKRQEYC